MISRYVRDLSWELNIYVSWSKSEWIDGLASFTMFQPCCDFLFTAPRRCFCCGSYLLFMYHVCLYYCVLLSCLFLAAFDHLLGKGWFLGFVMCYVSMFFVTFPYGVSGQVWYMIVPIPDLCPFPYFDCPC